MQSKIQLIRTERKLSQAQLAQKANVNAMMISRLERGERIIENTTLKTAVAIADALCVDVKELLK